MDLPGHLLCSFVFVFNKTICFCFFFFVFFFLLFFFFFFFFLFLDVVKLCKTESELKIKVTLPDEGDYILTIYAVDTEREDDPSAHPICCYLISTNMNPQEGNRLSNKSELRYF